MQQYQPIKLDEEEISDPCLVIFRLFDYAGPGSIREYLWHWLKVTVSGTYNTKLVDKYRRYDLIYLFEHIEKLVEAAYLINQARLKEQNKKQEEKMAEE